MSGLFRKMTITPCDKIHCNFVHLAAPWRRMPVVLKEDLGLSSLGLTGSRGMLQYGVAFMKIISRRSNDRLFDNPIRGETYLTCQLLRIQTLNQTEICGQVGPSISVPISGVAKVFNFPFNTFLLHLQLQASCLIKRPGLNFSKKSRATGYYNRNLRVTGYLKPGGHVVMWCITAAWWCLLFCQKLSIRHLRPCVPI